MRLVPLTFVRHGGKWYAETPTGEIAYGDNQGIYEWRDGLRIDYFGADRQCSAGGTFWSLSGQGAPKARGRQAAIRSALS